MNAFRILFLVIVLAGSVALALARVTPSVVENQTDDALAQATALESVLVAQMERTTRTARASTAQLIAADSRLERSLSDNTGASPSPMSMFRQATNAVVANPSAVFDAYVLTDGSGRVLDATSTVTGLANDGLAGSARVSLAVSERRVVHTYFEESGRLFGAAAAPIINDSGTTLGAVVLIEEYDDAMAASMRSGTDANTAFFVGRSVMGSNVGDDALHGHLVDVVARASASTVGTPGRILDRTRVEMEDRRVLIAPIRLAEPGVETSEDEGVVGVAVMTSGPIVPTNLPAVLARFRAFDEGTSEVWIVIGVGLLFFFLALTLLERALAIPVADMSRRIRDNATHNDPSPLPVKRYPAWVRDAAEAYNVFLEAYRAQTPGARSKRAESHSAAHLFMVDNSGGSRRVVFPSDERSGSGLISSGASAGASSAVFDAVDEASAQSEAPVGLLSIETGEPMNLQGAGSGAQAVAAIELEPLAADVPPDQMFADLADPVAPSVTTVFEPGAEGAPAAEPELAAEEATPAEEATTAVEAAAPVEELDAAALEAPTAAREAFVAVEEAPAIAAPSAVEPPPVPDDAPVTEGAASAADAAATPQPEPAPQPTAAESEATAASDAADVDWIALLDEVGQAISGSHVAAGDSEQHARPSESESTESSAQPNPPEEAPVQRTMIGVKFDTGQTEALGSEFQRLRTSSTPSDVSAVAEPTVGADASGIEGLFEAIAPPEPQLAPTDQSAPTPEAEKEGQIEDEVQSEDPQQSNTVPRVSLDELNRRAQGASPESGDQESLLAAAEARLRSLRPASESDGGPPEQHRELFDQFVSAKRECGEDTSRLTYQRFVAKLDRNRAALMSRYKCSDVRFDVATRDGKVTLKATPIR